MSKVLVAKVKNVLSGNSVVLVPSRSTQVPTPERTLSLSNVKNVDSWQCKEFLRDLLISKEVKFKVSYKNPTTGREHGDIKTPLFDSLVEFLLEKGMAKVKDNVNEDDEYIMHLRALEEKARQNDRGIWNTDFLKLDSIDLVELSDSIIEKSKKAPITLIVEKVINGDRIFGRLVLNKKEHLSSSFVLAGYKCPRTDDPNLPGLERKISFEAKEYVEDKLVTTKAHIRATILGKTQSGLPIVLISHPSGNNIHEKVLENGLGEIVDWHSTYVGSEMMLTLRKAEQKARALAKGLFALLDASSNTRVTKDLKKVTLSPGKTIEDVVVSKVISADTINVLVSSSDEEITVQLASVRGPRQSDTSVTDDHQKQLALVRSAREFVRNTAIGKTGQLYINGYREENKELGLDGRFLVNFKINDTVDLSELVVKNGYGSVIRHNKATSNERAINWDRLIEIEEEQKKIGKCGIFYKGDISKILTLGSRVVDASENAAKAKTFFNGFKQKGRISNGFYVDFVSGPNRVKLFNPKEGTRLNLVLGGLNNNKNDSESDEAVKYLNRKFLQRNVLFEIYDLDRVGNFVGNLYSGPHSNAAIQTTLLLKGYATINEIGIKHNPLAKELSESEEEARKNKRGVWKNFDEEKHMLAMSETENDLKNLRIKALEPKFLDVAVTDIGDNGVVYFHKVDPESEKKFASFKQQFNAFHSKPASASRSSADLPYDLTKPPKKGDLVSVKFAENNKYYRGLILGYDKTKHLFEVKHVDFGLVDHVPLSYLRDLPPSFSSSAFPYFANSCTLKDISLPPSAPKDYAAEALQVLDDLTYDKKLVASIVPSSVPGVEYTAILYDPKISIDDPSYTINKQLVEEGWGLVNASKVGGDSDPYKQSLKKAEQSAKSQRLGCWEYGDIAVDDSDLY